VLTLVDELFVASTLPDKNKNATSSAAARSAESSRRWVTTGQTPAEIAAPPAAGLERQPLFAWLSNASPDGAHACSFGPLEKLPPGSVSRTGKVDLSCRCRNPVSVKWFTPSEFFPRGSLHTSLAGFALDGEYDHGRPVLLSLDPACLVLVVPEIRQ
jgi:hypothetical protein